MSALSSGLAVEVGSIERALGELWEQSAETKTRASLLNLVIYCEDEDEAQRNTTLLAEIAGRYACRAILIFREPHCPDAPPQAWINAHCRKAGAIELCSEQITFRLRGGTIEDLPGVVFPNLDSDLPLALWWQAPLPAHAPQGFWPMVDRLLYDSGAWDKPGEELRKAEAISPSLDSRTILADLNWTRVLWARFAIAGLFDHASALAILPKIEVMEITHAPGMRMAAALLAGWFASKAGWKPAASPFTFTRPDGGDACCHFTAAGEEIISRCAFRRGTDVLAITHGGETFAACITAGGCDTASRAFEVPRESLADLLVAELSRGGRHANYRQALAAIRPWLDADFSAQ